MEGLGPVWAGQGGGETEDIRLGEEPQAGWGSTDWRCPMGLDDETTNRELNMLRDFMPTNDGKGRKFFRYPLFEVFLDCLWGLTAFFACYLLAFSFFSTDSLGSVLRTSAIWFQGAILVLFVYIYGLRLRRHTMSYLRGLR